MLDEKEWLRPSGTTITLKNTENLSVYAANSGWECVAGSSDDKNSCAGGLNLDSMDKNQLVAYAKDSLGIVLDRRKSEKGIVKQIRRHIES